jgi:outer membrane protein OmpA-like peptidoglycan-associated protein/uncharacterized protein YidB (DUF937 family)
MGTLDTVLADVGTQFGISGSKSTSLLSGLLSMITETPGGMAGFLDRFRQAGLSEVVSSWVGGNTPRPISNTALETAVGREGIDRIASKAGLSFATAASALSYMLPGLIQRLTPGGVVPNRLPSDILPYASSATAAVAAGTREAALAVERRVKSRAPAWLWPLLAVLALFLLGFWFWSSRQNVNNAAFNVADQVRAATAKATAALGALKPGFSTQELVTALNLNVINFASASAQIPTDSTNYLDRVAAAIKAAPAGTVLEIGGHTDNSGDSASNMTLSQQRADAVRAYLIQQGVDANALVTKGYGDSKPVAGNETDEGKFRNRRIEFTLR